MPRKFSELTDKMSPASKAKAKARTKALITAGKASQASKRGERNMARAQARTDAVTRRREQAARRHMLKQIPDRMLELGKVLRQATRTGMRSVEFDVSGRVEGEAIQHELEKLGYKAYCRRRELEENWGDFNAPYTVTSVRYWLDISWE